MKATWLLGMAMMSTGAHAATREEAIDAWMRDYTGQVPGASVLVLEDGEAVFQRSYGLADLEAGVASSPATNYRLASVSTVHGRQRAAAGRGRRADAR
jgi:CubicO group peptidase (beta-lactamase class C family)